MRRNIDMLDTITQVNDSLNEVVWGTFGLALLFAAGLIMTIVNKGFQFSHIGHWFQKTIGAVFSDKHVTAHTDKDDKSISQFQSLCTALAATIGTGNIVGISTAIISGGPVELCIISGMVWAQRRVANRLVKSWLHCLAVSAFWQASVSATSLK